jgi:hypothetical protein
MARAPGIVAMYPDHRYNYLLTGQRARSIRRMAPDISDPDAGRFGGFKLNSLT